MKIYLYERKLYRWMEFRMPMYLSLYTLISLILLKIFKHTLWRIHGKLKYLLFREQMVNNSWISSLNKVNQWYILTISKPLFSWTTIILQEAQNMELQLWTLTNWMLIKVHFPLEVHSITINILDFSMLLQCTFPAYLLLLFTSLAQNQLTISL